MKVFNYILSLVSILVFISCSSEKQEKIINIEMVAVEFEEPFVGILKSRPEILVWSLDHIPFSWFAPDTTTIEQEFEITFNEDCIRSKSEIFISITDTLKNPAEGLRVSFNNDKESLSYRLIANQDTCQTIKVKYKVKPELGDTIYKGFITVDSNDLDYINDNSLQAGENIAAKWTIEQELGWPIILWVLWFVCFLICAVAAMTLLYLIGVIIYYTIQLIYAFIEGLPLNDILEILKKIVNTLFNSLKKGFKAFGITIKQIKNFVKGIIYGVKHYNALTKKAKVTNKSEDPIDNKDNIFLAYLMGVIVNIIKKGNYKYVDYFDDSDAKEFLKLFPKVRNTYDITPQEAFELGCEHESDGNEIIAIINDFTALLKGNDVCAIEQLNNFTYIAGFIFSFGAMVSAKN